MIIGEFYPNNTSAKVRFTNLNLENTKATSWKRIENQKIEKSLQYTLREHIVISSLLTYTVKK